METILIVLASFAILHSIANKIWTAMKSHDRKIRNLNTSIPAFLNTIKRT